MKQLENVLLGYLSALAFYKFFYILNWVHRYYNEVTLNMKRVKDPQPMTLKVAS